jgi:TRAP-type C4-dicarboxylate transport system permease small subunit
MKKSRELKWHEEIFTGAISAVFGFVFLFNGFSYLTSLFIEDVLEKGKPTGQKALVALASLLEQGWWKYLIVLVFFLVAFFQIRTGVRKYKSRKEPH